MRILCTTQPGLGHFRPLAGLGQALQRSGHEVRVACSASFAPRVVAAGLRAVPAGIDWLEQSAESAFPALRDRALDGPVNAWPEVFASTTARAMLPDLEAIAAVWRPDLVIREPLEFAGALLAERLGLPHATAGPGLFATPTLRQRFLGPYLTPLREASGLPPDPDLRMLFRYLDLAFLPPMFLAGQQHLIEPVTHFLRPLPIGGGEPAALPDWLTSSPRPPVILVTLGTVFNATPGLFGTILAGLREEPGTIIVTTGEAVDPATLGPLPPGIHATRFLPLESVLPRCDVVVTHGGYNTVMASLGVGCPLVLAPVGADQLDNARRCIALGVGLGMTRDNLTPENVRLVTREVLANQAYRAAAARLRHEIELLPGSDRAVELVEQLGREREPVVSRR